MENRIKALSQKYLADVQAIRRTLHANPEIGGEEFATAKLISDTLTSLNIEWFSLADTGVVGLIKGDKPGKTVLLRADMDALPILEDVDVPYASKIAGMMHACGHDGHTAGLLGAAMILTELKANICGQIKLMFQPAEENIGGAERMIAAGLLENPHVDAAFGIHLWGGLAQGRVEVKPGAMMASPDSFHLKIIGKGGHAAMPHLTIDPINITMQIINAAQNIISRRIDPVKPAVISFCSIHAGHATNVIPQELSLSGTIRTLHPENRTLIAKLFNDLIASICQTNGATYDLDYHVGYPAVINDVAMTNLAQTAIAKIVGAPNVSLLEYPSMGGEDFAYLGQHVPASFYLVGIAPENQPNPIHHHPQFAWNDEVLEISAATLAQIAIDYLNQ
ncbi:MAG: M20 metallopeptidase family protein [Culicoidibacterales bacterium]